MPRKSQPSLPTHWMICKLTSRQTWIREIEAALGRSCHEGCREVHAIRADADGGTPAAIVENIADAIVVTRPRAERKVRSRHSATLEEGQTGRPMRRP
jgi:hypothetical protein